MKDLKPMLFSIWKDYSKEQFIKDVIAGIIVAIIALPLSIALALASGVGPEEGLYTAIVAGFIISFLGGSRVQIAGPTAAFATIVAGIVARSGMDGLMMATLMAGAILILMGLLKLGSLIKFIPYTITTGFTAGIAVTILVGQLKDFFGVTYVDGLKPVETMEKLEALVQSFSTWNVQAVIVGLVCLAVLVLWPKVTEKIPGSLIAILVGIALVKGLGMKVNTIGDLYTVSNALPTLHLPSFSLSTALELLPDAFTIAILAAIESLLSCVVADGMIGSKHRSNMELVAQGAGNIGSALFGGIPATGAIARTAANIKSGGRSPIAGMVHAVVLLLILVVLMPYAALIPMPTIAAILFKVAYDMCQWRPFVKLCRTAPKSDILILVLTFVLTVVFDLVVAIAVGLVLACVLFMKRMSDETGIRPWRDAAGDEALRVLPEGVAVYDLNGPLFFGVADQLAAIAPKAGTKCLIFRMGGVPAVDATALNSLSALYDRLAQAGIAVVLCHVGDQPRKAMEKAGLAEKVGAERFTLYTADAIALAEKLAR